MAELVVVGFDNLNDADRVLTELTRMQKRIPHRSGRCRRCHSWRRRCCSHQAERQSCEAWSDLWRPVRRDVGQPHRAVVPQSARGPCDRWRCREQAREPYPGT